MLTELKNRGVVDIFFPGLRWTQGPAAVSGSGVPRHRGADLCHPSIRGTFRYAGRQHRDAIAKAIKPIYTAPTAAAVNSALDAFDAEWGHRYPAAIGLWRNAWQEFIPFLDYDVEVRKVICSTNAIESLNARYRRAVRARGHFPNEQSALKCLYLVTRSLDPTGTGQKRWTMRWKPALNAFAITSPTACRQARTTQPNTPLTPLI